MGREASPSAAIIDSQSVKTTENGGPRGSDAGKKIRAASAMPWSIPMAGRCWSNPTPPMSRVFGPVAVTIGYDADDEAIAIANDSEFGLSGGIFSTDVGRAYEMALEIRTGRIGINGGPGGMSTHAPFGGIKRSGYGREYGLEGLNEFTYLKAIGFKGG